MTATERARPCPGPNVECMRSAVLLPYGAAMHYGGRVVCVVCGEPRSIARYVHDVYLDLDGRPIGAHVCRVCDPLTPAARRRGRHA